MTKISPTVLCRGAGHVSICGACFHKDDRFGNSWRCRQECKNIDGIWGPTVCCPECEKEPSANPVIGNGAVDQESVNDSLALEGEETILGICESEKGESVSCGAN